MNFNKEYMPGYTGHLPMKVDQFDITTGEVNRQIIDGFSHTSHTMPTSPGQISIKITHYEQ